MIKTKESMYVVYDKADPSLVTFVKARSHGDAKMLAQTTQGNYYECDIFDGRDVDYTNLRANKLKGFAPSDMDDELTIMRKLMCDFGYEFVINDKTYNADNYDEFLAFAKSNHNNHEKEKAFLNYSLKGDVLYMPVGYPFIEQAIKLMFTFRVSDMTNGYDCLLLMETIETYERVYGVTNKELFSLLKTMLMSGQVFDYSVNIEIQDKHELDYYLIQLSKNE